MRHRQEHISDIYPNILKFEVNMVFRSAGKGV